MFIDFCAMVAPGVSFAEACQLSRHLESILKAHFGERTEVFVRMEPDEEEIPAKGK